MNQEVSPVIWARWGFASRYIAKLWKPHNPPVLVLSLPRSGSSWVGEMLGAATDALYLREPVTQGDAMFYHLGTVIDPNALEIEPVYRSLADKAFIGWPDFEDSIVRFPQQWRLIWRRPRRVVIKEVNPLACAWYAQHYQPRIVFLVRHPAAVATSWRKLGWLGSSVDDWAKNGAHQGRALRAACDALAQYALHCTISYEALCLDALSEFKRLFDFAGLIWDDQIRERIRRKSQGEWVDGEHTSRVSAKMIDAWRNDVEADLLAALKEAYLPFDLPWYCDETMW